VQNKRINKEMIHQDFYKIFFLKILILANMLFAADWPMFRGNEQRTGFYQDPCGYPSKIPVWIDSLGCNFISSPSIYKNILYIGGRDSCIYAINSDNGNVLWKTKTKGWVDASPLIYKGMLIIGSRDGTIYVFDAKTGAEISRLEAGLQLSSCIATSDGTILSGLGMPHNGFAAYSFSNAKWDKVPPKWKIDFNQITYSSPALFGSNAFIGSSNGKLYGINVAKKQIAWEIQTEGGVYLSTPAISDTTVYFAVGNSDKNIYAIDATDGKLLWKSSGKPYYGLSKKSADLSKKLIPPYLFRELLRLSPQDRIRTAQNLNKAYNLYIPDILFHDKVKLAKIKASSNISDFYSYGEIKTSSVAVDKNNVYVIQKELGYPAPKFTLLALDKYSGEEKWSFSEMRSCMQIGYCSSPVVTSNFIFFGWGEGMIYCIETNSGKIIWYDTLKGDIISSPAIANARLYVATSEGYIYSYKLLETAPGLDFQTSTYCYPNPARGNVSHIQIYLSKAGTIDMTLYNSAEKSVFKLNRQLNANEKYTYDWNLYNVANGVYFALIKVNYNDGQKDKKILKIAVLK